MAGTGTRTKSKSVPVLAPLQQDTTSTLIARRLRDAIAAGQFAPGQQMLETSLAQSLGVSRGPLREAMQRLTQEGLLVGQRNRGLFVMELTQDAVKDMFLARGALERAAVEHLIDSGRNGEATVLLDIVRQMEAYHGDPSSPEVSELDMAFHEKLVELSDSPRLRRMHRTLLTQVRMCLTVMQSTYESIHHRVVEHRSLAEAIVDGDQQRAVELLKEHMADGLARLLQGAEPLTV